MTNTEKVTEALQKADCYMTLAAIMRATGLHSTQARQSLRELDEAELIDTISVLGDQHGCRARRCAAYMFMAVA